jgi:hypothetical protein
MWLPNENKNNNWPCYYWWFLISEAGAPQHKYGFYLRTGSTVIRNSRRALFSTRYLVLSIDMQPLCERHLFSFLFSGGQEAPN